MIIELDSNCVINKVRSFIKDKLVEFLADDVFPDGAEDGDINDYIWFEWDSCLEGIGVPSESEIAEQFLEENEDECLDILRDGVRLPESEDVVIKILELGNDVRLDDLSELFDLPSLGKKLEEKVQEAIEDEGLVREDEDFVLKDKVLDWFEDHIADILDELEEE